MTKDVADHAWEGEHRAVWEKASSFVESKSWGIAACIVVLGLALRCTEKLGYWINPDEGINYSIISHPTIAGCWNELMANTHPPMISVALWFMGMISLDPTWFRMLSLFCGCAAILGVWLAGRELAGKGSGLAAAALVAVSPSAIEQSQVIRPYMLQLAFLAYGIYFLGGWLRQRRGLVGFSICMTMAVTTQFSSFFTVGGCGLVLAGLFLGGRLKRADLRPLALAFIAPCAAMLVLFLVHIWPHLINGPLQAQAQATWLAPYFIQDTAQVWFNLLGLNMLLFGKTLAGPCLLFLLGAITLGLARRRTVTFLSATLLVIAILASATGHYPFGSTRHSGYLLLFVALAMGQAIGMLGALGPRVLAISVVGMVGLLLAGRPITDRLGIDRVPPPLPPEHIMSGEQWGSAQRLLGDLSQTDGLIVTNLQTYYFLYPENRQHWTGFPTVDELGCRFRLGRCEVVANLDWEMTLDPRRLDENAHLYSFLRNIDQKYGELRLRGRTSIWLLFGGWRTRAAQDLVRIDRQLQQDRKLIGRWLQHPGFFACELNVSRFIELFSGSRRQAGNAQSRK